MPRSRSIVSTTYTPNADNSPRTYGPWSVDQMTSGDTAALKVTLSVGADWPTDTTQPVVEVTLLWDTGGGGTFVFNGGLRNQDGTPMTEASGTVYVPTEGGANKVVGKRPIFGGNLSLLAHKRFTSAITIAAINEPTAARVRA